MPYIVKNGMMEFVPNSEKVRLFEDDYTRCLDCGEVNKEGAVGCRQCRGHNMGAYYSSDRSWDNDSDARCPDCGAENNDNAAQCGRCRAYLESKVVKEDFNDEFDRMWGDPPTRRACEVCRGTGVANRFTCSACDGKGWFPIDPDEPVEEATLRASVTCQHCGHPFGVHGGGTPATPFGVCLFAQPSPSGLIVCDCTGFVAGGMEEAKDTANPFDFCKNCGNKVKKAVAAESEKWNQQGHCSKKCMKEWDSKHFGCCGKAQSVECDECDQAYECVEHGPTHLGYHKKAEGKMDRITKRLLETGEMGAAERRWTLDLAWYVFKNLELDRFFAQDEQYASPLAVRVEGPFSFEVARSRANAMNDNPIGKYAYESRIREGADDDVRELELYARNTSELYGQFQSIIDNIKRRIKNHTYDTQLAPKLWMYWVDEAAKRYTREFGSQGQNKGSIFDRATRMQLAQELAAEEYEKIINGEYGAVEGLA